MRVEKGINELCSIFGVEEDLLISEDTNRPRLDFEAVKKWIVLYKSEYQKAKELIEQHLGFKANIAPVNVKTEIIRFKTKIYVNGETVDDFYINIPKGELNFSYGKKSFLYPSVYAFAITLRKLRPDFDIAIGRVREKDGLELTLRDIYFEGYYREIERIKRIVKEKRWDKFPIWQLLYFRPKWLFEVSRGILLYYLSPQIGEQEKRIIEEYYLKAPSEELTADELYIKEAIENKGVKLEDLETQKEGGIIAIHLEDDELKRVSQLAKIKGIDVKIDNPLKLPAWRWKDYLQYAREKSREEHILNLFLLKETFLPPDELRESILKDKLTKGRITRKVFET